MQVDEAWRKAAREALRAAAGPLASSEYRLTRQRERLEEIQSSRRNWEARGDMTEEDRRELDRTETEMLDTISAEEDGLILDELFDGMEDPSWPDVETEAELRDKIARYVRGGDIARYVRGGDRRAVPPVGCCISVDPYLLSISGWLAFACWHNCLVRAPVRVRAACVLVLLTRSRKFRAPGARRTRNVRCVTPAPSITPVLSSSIGSVVWSNSRTPSPSRTGTRSRCISSRSPDRMHCCARFAPITPTSLSAATAFACATALSRPSVTNVKGDPS